MTETVDTLTMKLLQKVNVEELVQAKNNGTLIPYYSKLAGEILGTTARLEPLVRPIDWNVPVNREAPTDLVDELVEHARRVDALKPKIKAPIPKPTREEPRRTEVRDGVKVSNL